MKTAYVAKIFVPAAAAALLAEDIAAIQRGDAELYFKERGGELFPAGGRLGGRAQGPVPLDRLVLRLKPWLRLAP
ncbi:hypothetical protein ACWEJQ_13105 [Streptomyces albidoflavus]